MVRVTAPQFDLEECNNETERAFIEALHAQAVVGNWNADAWVWDDRVVVAVSVCDQTPEYNLLLRTLRVDFDGKTVWFGPDETQQFATDLDPTRTGVSMLSGLLVCEMAVAAAEWLEWEMRRPLARQEWDHLDRRGVAPRLWVLADTGEGIAAHGLRSPDTGQPDRIVPVG